MSRKTRAKIIYAYHQDEEFIMTGTKEEIAEVLNVKPDSVLFYSYPVYKQRHGERGIVITRLGKEDEIE